jgi:hypothetical protein
MRRRDSGEGNPCPDRTVALPLPRLPRDRWRAAPRGDTNGGSIFWITDGPPDEWPLVLYNWRGGHRYETHEMPLVDFLVNRLSGEIPDCVFGVGIDGQSSRATRCFAHRE